MSLGRFSPEVPLKVGEARCIQARQGGDAIGGEEVPVPHLPGGGKALIARQAELQERHQCWRQHKEADHLAITGDLRMTTQEQLAYREWAGDHFAEQDDSPAAIEHRIHRVESVAIGTRS